MNWVGNKGDFEDWERLLVWNCKQDISG